MDWRKVNGFLTFFSIAFGAKFGEQALQKFMSLPFPLLVFTFLAFIAVIAIPAIVLVYLVKDLRYRATYKLLLRKLYDYVWNFLMSGLGTAYVVLAVGLAPFWMVWGTWLVLAIFAVVLYLVWLLREPRGRSYIRGRIHRRLVP